MTSQTFQGKLTQNDRRRSATTTHLDDLWKAISLVDGNVESLLDIGCGFGGLTSLVAEKLGARKIHGIDVDAEALREAQDKGIVTHHRDVSDGALPFQDNMFDMVISLGMLDYLPFFDPLLKEMHRVLKPGGYVVIALPNLASWNNRFALLLGYQPRDVEVSKEVVVGVHPLYKWQKPTGHIHTITTHTMVELMKHHGFHKVGVIAGRPKYRKINPLLTLIDAVLSKKSSLARRFFYVGQRL